MEVLRKVNGIKLNKGDGMARGLYNVSDDDSDGLSFWFDEEIKDELISLSDKYFLIKAEELIDQS
tara:strand:+ start:29633 stop:29827 length:195 start_codon:yes stop_codon:yes gene_type:complete